MTHEEIMNKYPHLFARKDLDMRQSCMCWGISCGDGWNDLIDKMSQEISDACPEAQYEQIKEKFGTLRVYLNGYNEQIDEIIRKYEDLSAITCEVCGKPGTLNDGGWLSCRCAEHKDA